MTNNEVRQKIPGWKSINTPGFCSECNAKVPPVGAFMETDIFPLICRECAINCDNEDYLAHWDRRVNAEKERRERNPS